MNDKDNICFNACLYAIAKLMKKGSCRYSWKNNDGKWNSIAWNEIMNWLLEKLNAESDKLKANDELLDKISAEIKAMSGDIETISDVLAIIDKYKKESEGGE